MINNVVLVDSLVGVSFNGHFEVSSFSFFIAFMVDPRRLASVKNTGRKVVRERNKCDTTRNHPRQKIKNKK